MGQWEFAVSPTTVMRILGTVYATRFGTAGVIREDDFQAGRIDFFGSYDPTQGGDATRFTLGATIEDTHPERLLRQQIFVTYRTLRLRENYTGFIQDPPAPYRSGFAQRGDEVDQTEQAVTAGARGSVRLRTLWRGLMQAIEAGYYGRFDQVDSAQRRLRYGTVIPYRVDFDLGESIANLGLFLDAELRPWRWLVLRGGVRGDYFNFDVLNRCDLHDATLRAEGSVVDVLCYTMDRTGPRDPTARRSAGGLVIQPRATALVGPFADVSFTASVGTGTRAADPSYLADGNLAPFASVLAAEGGAVYNHAFGPTSLTLRAIYYYTFVNRDLIFNQQEGRNTLAPGTRRQGGILAGRLTNGWLDWAASVTFADARFVREAMDPGTTYFPVDAGDRVPYVPTWVVRSDAGIHGTVPWFSIAGRPLLARAGVGVTYVSPRSLPYGEWSDPIFVVDAAAGVRWSNVEIGVIAQNLFDTRYRLGEYNYVADFRQDTPNPNLLASRLFTAGPPLGVFGTLTVYFGTAPPSDSSTPRTAPVSTPAASSSSPPLSSAAPSATDVSSSPAPTGVPQ